MLEKFLNYSVDLNVLKQLFSNFQNDCTVFWQEETITGEFRPQSSVYRV